MIEDSQLLEVGKFLKTHALRGELNAILDIDPDFFTDGNPLIVEIEGSHVPFYTESIRGKGTSGYLIKLDGIESADDARFLVNQAIRAEKNKLRDYMAEEGEEDIMLEDDIIGYEVIDSEFGDLGKIERIDDSTANTLFIILTPEEEEIFIPVTDEFIKEIDQSDRIVKVEIPKELLELNMPSGKRSERDAAED